MLYSEVIKKLKTKKTQKDEQEKLKNLLKYDAISGYDYTITLIYFYDNVKWLESEGFEVIKFKSSNNTYQIFYK